MITQYIPTHIGLAITDRLRSCHNKSINRCIVTTDKCTVKRNIILDYIFLPRVCNRDLDVRKVRIWTLKDIFITVKL